MLRVHHNLVFFGRLLVPGKESALVVDIEMSIGTILDVYGMMNMPPGDGVSAGLVRNQAVRRHFAQMACLQDVRRLAGYRLQGFPLKAFCRLLVHSAVDSLVGNVANPMPNPFIGCLK